MAKPLGKKVVEMPWKEKTVEKKREEFVQRALATGSNKSALCREYGISRPTGDKWIKRYQNGECLSDRSHSTLHTPKNKIADQIEELIVQKRKAYPGIGGRKLKRMLENDGYENMPSVSTFNAVLQRNKLITREDSRAATPYRRFQKNESNEMWQCDFKGNYEAVDGTRCYPLSVIDDYSRFCINADAKRDERRPGVQESFILAMREFGKPRILLCDNGNPWGTSQSTGYTGFEIWLMEHDILTIHIRVKHPQTQGKVERFNGSFKRENLRYHIPTDFEDAIRQRLEYRQFYNRQRPHNALNLETPASVYEPGRRKYTEEPMAWEYPEGEMLRRIKSTGYLTYNGQGYFLSEALGKKLVSLKPSQKDGFMNVIYRSYRVARIDLREHTVVSRKAYLLKDDPRNER